MVAITASLHAIDRILGAMTDADGERLRKALHGGQSAASIARDLAVVGHDIHQSSVKRWRASHTPTATTAPRTLVIDIESSPNFAGIWGLFDQNVGLVQLEDVSHVMCFAAKWLGDKKVHFYSEHHDGREAMIEAAWRLLDEADCVIGYNSKSFDVKHLHREFVLAEMPPPSPHKDLDLLTIVRSRFKFVSSKLDHVAAQLGLGTKLKHQGYEMWRACLNGDEAAWKTFRSYNIQDVRLTEALYYRIQGWIKGHPHHGLYGGDVAGCPNCGSSNLSPNATVPAGVSMFAAYRCDDCGANSRSMRRVGVTTATRSA